MGGENEELTNVENLEIKDDVTPESETPVVEETPEEKVEEPTPEETPESKGLTPEEQSWKDKYYKANETLAEVLPLVAGAAKPKEEAADPYAAELAQYKANLEAQIQAEEISVSEAQFRFDQKKDTLELKKSNAELRESLKRTELVAQGAPKKEQFYSTLKEGVAKGSEEEREIDAMLKNMVGENFDDPTKFADADPEVAKAMAANIRDAAKFRVMQRKGTRPNPGKNAPTLDSAGQVKPHDQTATHPTSIRDVTNRMVAQATG